MSRMTIDLDDNLYTAIKVVSARRHRSAKDIITDALKSWLQDQEDIELKEEIKHIRAEWTETGGMEASEFFESLKSDKKGDAG